VDGQERAPELLTEQPYDPYKLDVYILGMAYQHLLIEDCIGADFIQPLITYMTLQDSSSRPSAVEAYKRFQAMRGGMSNAMLAKRVCEKFGARPESALTRIIRDAKYRIRDALWTRQAHPVPLPPWA